MEGRITRLQWLLPRLLHVAAFLVAVHGAAAAQLPLQPNAPTTSPLRIWIDEFFFAGGETELLREAVAASSGGAVLAGDTRNRVFQLKSYQVADKLDVMWTGRPGCYEAFRRKLNATHAVSCVPGTQAVSGKADLIASLAAAYGEAAWGIVPRSFRVPQQYADMAAHMKQEQRSGRGSLWVLKEDVHRGQGVGVVTPPQALAHALDPAPGGGRKHVLVQQFLGDQYLVAGRPFYIRLWAVLVGADPVRAYLYDGGVVVFGQQQQEGQSADALIVNLWTQDRAAAAPWALLQLERHLAAETGSAAAPQRLRRQMHAAVAASLAAGLPNVRRAAGHLAGFQGGSFEVLGIDFLVDSSLRPWLVEVNFLPSMARKVIGCSKAAAASDGAEAAGEAAGSSADREAAAQGDTAAHVPDGARSSGGGVGSGGSTGGTAPSSDGTVSGSSGSSTGAADCQQDNPFDAQKQGFMAALLQLLITRHQQHASLEQQAEQLLQEASAAAEEEQQAPCVLAPQLRQLLAMQAEQAAAEQLGFVPLTQQLYRSLGCMAARPTNSSGASSSLCDSLADLAPPAAPALQQCTAPSPGPGSSMQQLLSLLRSWGGRLLLEAASAWPRLRHPEARQRRQQGAAAAAHPPYPLRESDHRMLGWMQRGNPPLTSLTAVQQYCDAVAP